MASGYLRLVVSNDVNGLYEMCARQDGVFKFLHSPALSAHISKVAGVPPFQNFAEFIDRLYPHGFLEGSHTLDDLLQSLLRTYFFLQTAQCRARTDSRGTRALAAINDVMKRNLGQIKLAMLELYPRHFAQIILASSSGNNSFSDVS